MKRQFAKIITSIPGPMSQKLMERKSHAVPNGAITNIPVFIKKAENFLLKDVDGNVFIDFGSGIGVMNVGHANEMVVESITAQAQKFTHTCFHMAMYESYIEVAERLNKYAPGSSPKKTYLVNSGAEAIENAVKIARRFTGKSAIVAFEHAFHGRTLLGLTLTGKVSPYREGFGPMAPEVYHLPFPGKARKPMNVDTNPMQYNADFITEQLKTVVPTSIIAAFIIEPVLGEGGILPFDKTYLNALVEFARANNILLIADEIQTGWGRTGHLFAMEHFDHEPDILVSAKSIAGGMPLSAVVGKAEIMDSVQPAGIGSTYSGNPVACAAAIASIDFIVENDLPKKANHIGNVTRERLNQLVEKYEFVSEVRGLGAMNGVEFVVDKVGYKPAPDSAKRIQKICYENGLIVLKAGSHSHVMRMLPPLTISEAALNEGLDIFISAVENL